MEEGIKLRVITPDALFYEGRVSSIIVKTVDGYMGFLRGRAPACVLLAEDGKLRFREIPGQGDKNRPQIPQKEQSSPAGKKKEEEEPLIEARIEGGFAYMKGNMTIYTDSAKWEGLEEEEESSQVLAETGGPGTQPKKEKLTLDTQPKE